MRSTRLLLFTLTIIIGIAFGVIYGWVIRPGDSRNLTLDTLSRDYQTDYVLMSAEAFKRDGDLPEAVRRLGLIDSHSPEVVVAGAVLTARELGYIEADMNTLNQLQEALRASVTAVPDAADNAEATRVP